MSVVYWNSNLPDNEKSVKQRVLSGERVLENEDLGWIYFFEWWVRFLVWNSSHRGMRLRTGEDCFRVDMSSTFSSTYK